MLHHNNRSLTNKNKKNYIDMSLSNIGLYHSHQSSFQNDCVNRYDKMEDHKLNFQALLIPATFTCLKTFN